MSRASFPNDSLAEFLRRARNADLGEEEVQMLERLASSLQHLNDSLSTLQTRLTETGEAIEHVDSNIGPISPRAAYVAAGMPFGPCHQARGIWRLFRQATTLN